MNHLTASPPVLPDPELQPTVPLWPVAGKALGIGRSTTYASYERGDFPVPVLKIGGCLRVATAELRRKLGLS